MIMNELAVFLLRTKAIDDLPLIVSIVSIVASILLTATKSGEKQRNVVLITLTGILCVACFGISAITNHYNNEYSLVKYQFAFCLCDQDGNSYEWRHAIMVVSNEDWTSVTP